MRGYVGRSVEYPGKDVEAQSATLLTIAQMQELLEDWIAVEWQNRSHDSLRDPLHPTITLSPNEMCRAFRQVAPELHVPLTRDDFIGLLPLMHRRINRYGVTWRSGTCWATSHTRQHGAMVGGRPPFSCCLSDLVPLVKIVTGEDPPGGDAGMSEVPDKHVLGRAYA